MDRDGGSDHRATTALRDIFQLPYELGALAALGEGDDCGELRLEQRRLFVGLHVQEDWQQD